MANKVHTHFLPVRRTSSPSQSFHFVSSSSFCVVCVLFAFFSFIRLVCIGANSYIWLFCVLCCWVGVACAFLISKLSETFFPSQEWIMWAIFSSRSLLCGIILLLLSPVHLRIHMPLRFTHKNNISLSFHFGFRRVCVCVCEYQCESIFRFSHDCSLFCSFCHPLSVSPSHISRFIYLRSCNFVVIGVVYSPIAFFSLSLFICCSLVPRLASLPRRNRLDNVRIFVVVLCVWRNERVSQNDHNLCARGVCECEIQIFRVFCSSQSAPNVEFKYVWNTQNMPLFECDLCVFDSLALKIP